MLARIRKHSQDSQPRSVFQIHPLSPTQFLATTSDNVIRIWSLPDLIAVKQVAYTDYVYALNYDENSNVIYVGDGSGNLLTLDLDLKETKKQKIHTDLLTQILLTKEWIITASVDYKVKILDRNTWQEKQVFNFSQPVWNIRLIQGVIYVCLYQKPSAKIIQFKEVVPLKLQLKTVIQVPTANNTTRVMGNNLSLNKMYDLETEQVIQQSQCHGLAYFKENVVILNNRTVVFKEQGKEKKVYRFPCQDNPSILDVKQVGEYLVVGLDNGKIIALSTKEK